MKYTIALTGGGTAGHVTPNLALLPELKKYFEEIYYIGEKGGVEEKLAEKSGLDFYGVTCVKFSRSKPLQNVKIPKLLKEGVEEATRVLKLITPSVVFAKGGFVSLPAVFAARKLDIPYALHESDASLGLANKLIKGKAEKIFTSFKGTAQGEIVTGNPIRSELYFGDASRAPSFPHNRPVVLVVGGSSGAASINQTVEKALPYLNEYNVAHITGKGKGNSAKGITLDNYRAIEFSDRIQDLYAQADVVVTRAGANALSELVALGKRVVAIPLPKGASRGDQSENAEYYRLKGLIDVLPQEELNEETLVERIERAMSTPERTPIKSRAAAVITRELYEIALRQKT
ncbi:MAG: UDP-N-acetylglucosamine--N-acetylmuramyl-(pentapeptide) pyrophosphoryl-undecaprenol N-acetylglucosamine transferase [Clostridia bacterium]|nr:UDP-N-acetylglucosamine--N-acetylmuramyl-(pentapeptide) pyrophosphoryl-undecaprenol N-acetylglucosamine transferase [Clostridia bacterium]